MRTRRELLTEVGRGMLLGSAGAALALDLGLAPARADEEPKRLSFGKLEPLASLLQETPLERLTEVLIEKLRSGAELRTLVAAGALANARTFGGEDYVGYHAFMALAPALQMADELPAPKKALPVLKVLYRNTERMQKFGGVAREVLHPVRPAAPATGQAGGEALREATRRIDRKGAEELFAALVQDSVREAYGHLQLPVQDACDVHRVVLAWRGWVGVDLVGEENAHTLLRQSVRYCLNSEAHMKRHSHPEPAIRRVLPRLLDQYRLLGRPAGKRQADDAWVEELAGTIFSGSPEQAADAAAQALAAGFDPEAVGEAISAAACMLLLHDPGRSFSPGPEKPLGSVHGDSIGVHASDAANAWRNIARVGGPRAALTSLVVGAYHTAGQAGRVGKAPWPLDHEEAGKASDPAALLRLAEQAIRAGDQALAGAAVHRLGELGGKERPVFDLLLRYATSEDGALHAEKYYRTVAEEFASTRARLRWRQLVALARVTASEYGRPAPGYREASRLLKVGV